MNALLFGVYGFFMDIQMKNPGDDPTLMQIYLAGTGSGIVNRYPLQIPLFVLIPRTGYVCSVHTHTHTFNTDILPFFFLSFSAAKTVLSVARWNCQRFDFKIRIRPQEW